MAIVLSTVSCSNFPKIKNVSQLTFLTDDLNNFDGKSGIQSKSLGKTPALLSDGPTEHQSAGLRLESSTEIGLKRLEEDGPTVAPDGKDGIGPVMASLPSDDDDTGTLLCVESVRIGKKAVFEETRWMCEI